MARSVQKMLLMRTMKAVGVAGFGALSLLFGCASAPEGAGEAVGQDEGATRPAEWTTTAQVTLDGELRFSRGKTFSAKWTGKAPAKARIRFSDIREQRPKAELEWTEGPLVGTPPVTMTGSFVGGSPHWEFYSDSDLSLDFTSIPGESSSYSGCDSSAGVSIYMVLDQPESWSDSPIYWDISQPLAYAEKAYVNVSFRSPCDRGIVGLHLDWFEGGLHDFEAKFE